MLPRMKELIGQRFGRLLVIGLTPSREIASGERRRLCVVRCECGNEAEARPSNLRSGNTTSCGCMHAEMSAAGQCNFKHGGSATREYRAWMRMKERCYNPKSKRYEDWGGRGITVCDRWLEGFENFLADMGPRPSPRHSLDRKDNDGNYEPSNCRWATYSEQNLNRRPFRTYRRTEQCHVW